MLSIYGICLCVVLLSLNTVTYVPQQTGSARSYQVGAWGDSASRGNLGVRVEIRTNIYPIAANSNHADIFWVGSVLQNGSFIQFGYDLLPANQTCTSNQADAYLTAQGCIFVQLFWEYWPNGTGKVFVHGNVRFNDPAAFEVNGTWHSYEIAPTTRQSAWSFKLDGQLVSTATFPFFPSKDAVYAAAEQATYNPPDRLGPAEFRNMSYLKQDGWHQVEYLQAAVSCQTFPGSPHCSGSIPYGVSAIGPNDFVAGSGIVRPLDGSFLWPKYATPMSLFYAVFSGAYKGPYSSFATSVSQIVWVILIGAIALAVLKLKRKIKSGSKLA